MPRKKDKEELSKVAMQCHPDRNQAIKSRGEIQDCSEAYEVFEGPREASDL